MNKKKTILTLALAFFSVLALGVGSANAGPSKYYFDIYNNVYVEVSQLGTFGEVQWAILAMVDLAGSPPDIGLGFSFYHPNYGDLLLSITRNAGWFSHSRVGVWSGSGGDFAHAVSTLFIDVSPLTTTPPAITSDSSADPSAQ